MSEDHVRELVEKLIQDPAAYDALRARIEAEPSERLDALLEAVDTSNPPLLATGGTN
jgi:hypothetical protein